jgi:signal transduction histidine kinase
MRGDVEPQLGARPAPPDCAQRVEDAARAAALAERRRLARDLHDSTTQTLISLQLTAQAAVELWDTQPARARAALDTVRQLAACATVEMRALLVDLHNAVLEQRGLLGALEVFSAMMQQRSGLQVELRVEGAHWPRQRLPAAYEEALYRLVQESLANVVKHAHASRALITLAGDTRLRVCVEDDGLGFGAPAGAFTYGLRGMRERVEALGGRLHLDNGPAGGARVVAELPIPDVLGL